MSKNVYEAVRTKLQAEGQQAVATIELLLKQPTAFPNDTNIVEEITRLTLQLVQAEGALVTLEQYFSRLYAAPLVPPAPPAPPATPRPPDEEIKVVTPEMSPTLRRELENQELRAGPAPEEPPETETSEQSDD